MIILYDIQMFTVQHTIIENKLVFHSICFPISGSEISVSKVMFNSDSSRPSSSLSGTWRRGGVTADQQTEEEIRLRQKQQLNQFYQNIDQHKENQLRVDLESRKHHDTLLPNQKSPVPLNRSVSV